jgi:1-acyl-sn-glycerol-3-phosphate acyltransferase
MLIPVPRLLPQVPKRGGPFSRGLGRLLSSLAGWRIEGNFPDLRQFVVVVAPHTSNWDFLVGMRAVFALGLRVSFLGKHTLFWWPLSAWLRYMGGIAVDRSAAHGVVEQVVEQFRARPDFLLAVTPTGTRRLGTTWRMGFYHVALGAGVPVVPVAFDYRTREVRIGPALPVTGDLQSDLEPLRRFFTGVQGRRGGPYEPRFGEALTPREA